MTTLGQSVSFSGRDIGFVIDGDGSEATPWKFGFPNKDGGYNAVSVVEATSLYFEYTPTDAPAGSGFNEYGGDLVAFRPCEAKFQGQSGPFTEGVKIDTWLIYSWYTFTLHYAGSTYPDTTPYVVLVDPDDANCYVLCAATEITKLA